MGQCQGKPKPYFQRGIDETTTPILMASFCKSEKKFSVAEGDPFSLHSLAYLGSIDEIREILLNEDLSQKALTRRLNAHGMTPAHFAALKGGSAKTEIVKLFMQHDANDPRSIGLPPLVNLQDVEGNTLLHYVVLSRCPDLVEALLQEHNTDPNIANLEGLTPLHVAAKEAHYESAVMCAQALMKCLTLNAFEPSCGPNHFKQTAVHFAAESRGDKMLKFLIGQGFYHAAQDDKGCTPLHLAVGSGDTLEAVNCVKYLLSISNATEINIPCLENGQTALHIAAYRSHPRVLASLLECPKTGIWVRDSQNRTALHWAVEAWFRLDSLECVKLLVECDKVDDWLDKVQFIFGPLAVGPLEREESPMNLALKNRCIRIAEYLILAHETPAVWLDDQMLEQIYTTFPEAIIPLMTATGISCKPAVFREGNECVNVEFGFVTGFRDLIDNRNERKSRPETMYLHHILLSSTDIQRNVLLHPLTQIFIGRKWDKIKHLTWISIIYQFIWLLLYTILVTELYVPDCAFGPPELHNVSKKSAPKIWLSLAFYSKEDSTLRDCVVHHVVSKSVVLVLYIITALILVKETFQFWHYYNYRREISNWAQLALLVIFLVNSIPAWSDGMPSPWQIYLAALGIFMAWVLSLREISKFPSCGIYSAVLKTVFWHCLKLLLFYIPLLVAFALCLRLLIPGKGQYNYLFFAIVKVVAMMTGELDFEDTFYDEDGPKLGLNFIFGQLVFLLLVFTTTIVLLNLLTALAVNDVNSLIEEAGVNRLNNELRQIYLMETFVLALRDKAGVFMRNYLTNVVHTLNVTSHRNPDIYFASKISDVETRYFPPELKQRIKDIMVPDDGLKET